MKTRRILALIMTVAMLFSMIGPSLAMAEEQLILDSIEIAEQQENDSDVLDLDNVDDLEFADPNEIGDASLDISNDLGDLVTGVIGEDTPHTVSFDARGGEPQPEAQTVVDGGFAQKPEEDPVLDGYVFTGWFLDEEDFFAEGVAHPIYGDVTLVAGWVPAEQPAESEPTEVGQESEAVGDPQPEAPATEDVTVIDESVEDGFVDEASAGDTSEEAQPAEPAEEGHMAKVERVEDEWFITADHPMTKEHYISFVAFATAERINFVKQYPEWDLQLRIPARGHGMLLWYCAEHGLFYQLI